MIHPCLVLELQKRLELEISMFRNELIEVIE